MKVADPGKFKHSMSVCDLLKQFLLCDREIQPSARNRDRFSEQHSCRDLTGEHLSPYT
ncbi:MAG: hypothetical protein QNJ55_14110 [Xenococcus sp. MO_188.B8]|nr:hypothetical protein [Xenococcus sp. MO_188.B8]